MVVGPIALVMMLGIVGGGGALSRADDGLKATPQLIAVHDAIVPGGTTFLGITFDIAEHWHLYWNGYNDAGLPPKVAWELPEGFKAGEILWPAPTRQVMDGDILNHIYEKRVTLLVPLEAPSTLAAGSSVEIAANLKWLVCQEACIAEEGRVTLTLPVTSDGASIKPSSQAKLIQEARERLPRQLPAGGAVTVAWTEDTCTISSARASAIAFFPGAECAPLLDTVASTQAKGTRLVLKPEAMEPSTRLMGIVEITSAASKQPDYYTIDTGFKGIGTAGPSGATPSPTPGRTPPPSQPPGR